MYYHHVISFLIVKIICRRGDRKDSSANKIGISLHFFIAAYIVVN